MHKRFGFTIVELLIVIAIISILASIVVLSYTSYITNTQKAKIASTVSAYQLSLQGVTFEQDNTPSTTYAACTSVPNGSNNGYCCYPYLTPNTWLCGVNSADPTGDATAAYNKIKKYLPNNQPSLPSLIPSSWSDCSGSWFTDTGPCKMNNVTYWASIPLSSGPSSTPGLVYYLPSTYDCNSPNTLKYDGSTPTTGPFTYSKQSGTLFSRRVTGSKPFTECVVSLK